MKLIDADALNYVRVRIYHEDGTIGGYNAVVPSSEIRNAPTIDAVPIKFIEEELNTIDEIIIDTMAGKAEGKLPAEIWIAFHSAIKTLIERWDDQNDRADGTA